jgi:hypothetical protein
VLQHFCNLGDVCDLCTAVAQSIGLEPAKAGTFGVPQAPCCRIALSICWQACTTFAACAFRTSQLWMVCGNVIDLVGVQVAGHHSS